MKCLHPRANKVDLRPPIKIKCPMDRSNVVFVALAKAMHCYMGKCVPTLGVCGALSDALCLHYSWRFLELYTALSSCFDACIGYICPY